MIKSIWKTLTSRGILAATTLIGFGLSIYTGFYYERKPSIEISIRALSEVFDVHSPVGGLEVSYAGKDLRASEQTLWILEASIRNDGNAVIGHGDYAEAAPLGLKIEHAVIAEPPTVSSSVQYLRDNVKVAAEASKLLFSPVILEAGESFDVKVLLLGSESQEPNVLPIGKVAGVSSFKLVTPESPAPEARIWEEALAASTFWVHPARVLIYLVLIVVAQVMFVALIMTFLFPFDLLRAKRHERERRMTLKAYKPGGALDREARFIASVYEEQGEGGIRRISEHLRSRHERALLAQELRDGLTGERFAEVITKLRPYDYWYMSAENKLLEAGLLEGEGEKASVSEKLEIELQEFYKFLEHRKSDGKTEPQVSS